MDFICQYCGHPKSGDAYRMISQQSGFVVLDLLVCGRCAGQVHCFGFDVSLLVAGIESSQKPGRQLTTVRLISSKRARS